MCDYCEGYYTNFDVDNDYSVNSVVINAALDQTSWHSQILMIATIDGGIFGQKKIESKFYIKYCPMCGRKLEDTENV